MGIDPTIPPIARQRVHRAIDQQIAGEALYRIDKSKPVRVMMYDPTVIENDGKYFQVDDEGNLEPCELEIPN